MARFKDTKNRKLIKKRLQESADRSGHDVERYTNRVAHLEQCNEDYKKHTLLIESIISGIFKQVSVSPGNFYKLLGVYEAYGINGLIEFLKDEIEIIDEDRSTIRAKCSECINNGLHCYNCRRKSESPYDNFTSRNRTIRTNPSLLGFMDSMFMGMPDGSYSNLGELTAKVFEAAATLGEKPPIPKTKPYSLDVINSVMEVVKEKIMTFSIESEKYSSEEIHDKCIYSSIRGIFYNSPYSILNEDGPLKECGCLEPECIGCKLKDYRIKDSNHCMYNKVLKIIIEFESQWEGKCPCCDYKNEELGVYICPIKNIYEVLNKQIKTEEN